VNTSLEEREREERGETDGQVPLTPTEYSLSNCPSGFVVKYVMLCLQDRAMPGGRGRYRSVDFKSGNFQTR
jgi:hypothetical protein